MKPTVMVSDRNGYQYDATSPEWKQLCAALPCFAPMEWPGYATRVIEEKIDGEPVVIQLWKGFCPQFFGRTDWPGGFGGEVGVYKRASVDRPLPDLTFLPRLARELYKFATYNGGSALWWPDLTLQPEITFELVNPKTRRGLLGAGPEKTYWLNKWMEPGSYEQYAKANEHPFFATDYKMVFTVAGKTHEW